MKTYPAVPQNVINAVRFLSADAVQKATCGHPGTPMGAAEMMLVLWAHFLRFDPQDPQWRDRDRFILSAGHASMLQYSLLNLFGYDCTLEDISNFRVLGSRTAGHPEVHHLPGIEMTTGPLGQGVSSAVGFALGQALLAGAYNGPDGQGPVSGRVWAFAGDGCMMEGISSEAASLAGHLAVPGLTVIYDQNHVSIDGSTDLAFTEDVGARYQAYGWRVLKADANDQGSLCQAFEAASQEQSRPTLIIAKSIIGRGSVTLEGSPKTHGEVLGVAEIEAMRKKWDWNYPPFVVPAEVYAWCQERVAEKKKAKAAWEERLSAWKQAQPAACAAWDAQYAQALPSDLLAKLSEGMAKEKAATRKHSHKVINRIAALMPWFNGGSADLTGSNGVGITNASDLKRSANGGIEGRNFHFGVREHAMGAIVNGLNLHGAWRSYGATFLQFADYMRPTIRLAALMKTPSLFVFSHDSIFLGEDGPTHQAIEHVSALRLIPNLAVWRPADGLETAAAWTAMLQRTSGPSVLCLTRQNVPLLPFAEGFDPARILKGGYVLVEDPSAALTIIATGSEVGTAVEAMALMAKAGLKARLVSLPSTYDFMRQDAAYREAVLGKLPRVSYEAGSTAWWPSLVGSNALCIGVDEFGMSGPGEQVAQHFHLDAPSVAQRIQAWMQKA
jgi:transketolase